VICIFLCNDQHNIDGKVPTSYYLGNKQTKAVDEKIALMVENKNNMIHLHLPPGSKQLLEFRVDSPGSMLR
jgi:hypothetical protein